jgi:hypothetical protein
LKVKNLYKFKYNSLVCLPNKNNKKIININKNQSISEYNQQHGIYKSRVYLKSDYYFSFFFLFTFYMIFMMMIIDFRRCKWEKHECKVKKT